MNPSTVVLLLCGCALAQTPIAVDETLKATQLAWVSEVVRPVIVRIDHGSAKWRPAHTAEVTRKAAATFPIGSSTWATLHAGAELKLGGRTLPAGIWYLALHRDEKANWSLAILDPTKIRTFGRQPGDAHDAKPDLLAEMKLVSGLELQDELQIALTAGEGAGDAVLTMRWGEHSLATAFRVAIEKDERTAPGFRQLDEARTVQTESGLRYQELRPGVGRQPGPNDKVRVHYVGWLSDGTKFDATFDRKQSASFPLNAVIKGWQEGVLLMKPGSVFLFEVPPELGYGARGAPPRIPAQSTLMFWIELIAVE